MGDVGGLGEEEVLSREEGRGTSGQGRGVKASRRAGRSAGALGEQSSTATRPVSAAELH